MKKFWSSVALCLTLLLAGLYTFQPVSRAQNNLSGSLLALPAPPPPNPLVAFRPKERPADFFSQQKPPADDAPIADLLDYWRQQNQIDSKSSYSIKPSPKSLDRLLDEIEKKPEILPEFLRLMGNSEKGAETVKRLYDEDVAERRQERGWRSQVKSWLTYNTPYFSDELLRTAGQAGDAGGYVTNQDEVLALARVDWDKAQPLLERMLGDPAQPVAQTLARWARYQHALRVQDSADIEKYRRELQETVENKNLSPGNRDLAMDALVLGGDFPGRDEWYFSLLEDESLHELRVGGQIYTGLTTLLNHSPPEKYVEKMVELAASSSSAVRSAAVRNLTTLLNRGEPRAEIVRALLPWLENRNWAKDLDGGRRRLVEALRQHAMPESVPGLIALLNEKQTSEVTIRGMTDSNYAGNTAVANTTAANTANTAYTRASLESYPLRNPAVLALEKQRDVRAAAPLRQILPLVEEWERQSVVRAALACYAYTVAEQLDALEYYAKNLGQESENANVKTVGNIGLIEDGDVIARPTNAAVLRISNGTYDNLPQMDPNNPRFLLASQLTGGEYATPELVAAIIRRIEELEKKDPPVAAGLRGIVRNWRGAAVNSLHLKDLKTGRADADAVVLLLAGRRELRETQRAEIDDARAGTATARGIGACLLEETGEYEALLGGDDREAKTALLACARLIRAELPVAIVAADLKSPHPPLAQAAAAYLETLDTPEARQAVLAAAPDEAKILGARFSFAGEKWSGSEQLPALFASVNPLFEHFTAYQLYPSDADDDFATERELRREVKENPALVGVYAYDDNFIRIYRDRAVFSWQDDPARYRERTLAAEEFENFKNFLVNTRADELPPFIMPCESCRAREFVMLGRGGGRRVFVHADPLPEFFADLENLFAAMRRPPARLRYRLESHLPGLEILWADENLAARNLWKNGADFRLLIEDLPRGKTIERELEDLQNGELSDESGDGDGDPEMRHAKIAERKKFENFAWHRFDGKALGDATLQPNGIEEIPLRDQYPVAAGRQSWKTRAANVQIRFNEEGFYKISGAQFAKIRKGVYDRGMIAPSGRWAVVSRYGRNDEEGYDAKLVRVNLATNREFPVKIEPYPFYDPLAFLPLHNKFLLYGGYYSEEEEAASEAGEYFLLDPETGAVAPAKGEFRPLMQQTTRALQPVAGAPGEFWAAIPDPEKNETIVGRYLMRSLSFTPLLAIPRIRFDSMNLWADETEGKIYFVYEGQLLALPLKPPR